jgi:hypothetical protein
MPYRANYPATVSEVLDDSMRFNPAALAAVRALARARPWRGTRAERFAKLQNLNCALASAYGLPTPRMQVGARDCFVPAMNLIVLSRRLSVVSFLHEFGHARGFDERRTCRWSINLFRRCFPRSYARCRHVGHTLVRA